MTRSFASASLVFHGLMISSWYRKIRTVKMVHRWIWFCTNLKKTQTLMKIILMPAKMPQQLRQSPPPTVTPRPRPPLLHPPPMSPTMPPTRPSISPTASHRWLYVMTKIHITNHSTSIWSSWKFWTEIEKLNSENIEYLQIGGNPTKLFIPEHTLTGIPKISAREDKPQRRTWKMWKKNFDNVYIERKTFTEDYK